MAAGVDGRDACVAREPRGRSMKMASPKTESSPEYLASSVEQVAGRLVEDCECLQGLPRELLVDIAEHFLESPVWHLCQLGEASPDLGRVFMDEALWQSFFEERFREASRSPRRRPQQRAWSPGARLSYAQLHLLEMRFRKGLFGAKSTLTGPRTGVAVLDIRIAPNPTTNMMAYAALWDGSIVTYDLEPDTPEDDEADANGMRTSAGPRKWPVETAPPPGRPFCATPLRVLTQPREDGAAALCCLPIELAAHAGVQAFPQMLAAGFGMGQLGAWELPSGRPIAPQWWEAAHVGRVSAITVLGGSILSAGSDGLVKAWDMGEDRFGTHQQTFPSHTSAVVSVASAPLGGHMFVTGSHDRTVRLWDMRLGGENAAVARWQQQDWATCVAFHPTAADLFLSSDKSIHQWDLRRAGSSAIDSRHRHRKLISRFQVDPLRLASCSLDGCVKASSLEEPSVREVSPKRKLSISSESSQERSPQTQSPHPTDAEACTLRASKDYVLCIDFDETRLLAGGIDGRVDVYDFSHAGQEP